MVQDLPLLDTVQIDDIDAFYHFLRALQSVDEMLENITNLLETEGIVVILHYMFKLTLFRYVATERSTGICVQTGSTDKRLVEQFSFCAHAREMQTCARVGVSSNHHQSLLDCCGPAK